MEHNEPHKFDAEDVISLPELNSRVSIVADEIAEAQQKLLSINPSVELQPAYQDQQ